MTTLPPLAEKALRYIAERRVQVVSVHRDMLGHLFADCLVYGSRPEPYSVARFGALPWSCSCRATVNPCSHVLACALVVPDVAGEPTHA